MLQTLTQSSEQYLQEERQRTEKHEYFNEQLIKMSGASFIHNVIASNLHILLGNYLQTQEKDFFVCQSDLRVYNEKANSYTYPDLVVIQGEPNFVDDVFDTITNPLLVIEILSSSTGNYDKTDKYLIYKELNTLQEYVLVHQKKQEVTIFQRESAHKWTVEHCKPTQKSTLKFESIGLEIAFDKIYKGVQI